MIRSTDDKLFDDDDQDAKMIEPDIFNFTGRKCDSETALHYNRARHYDPTVGRWINEDPAGFEDGDVNLYRYVGNAPCNDSDPTA